jgi:hypothetical protein
MLYDLPVGRLLAVCPYTFVTALARLTAAGFEPNVNSTGELIVIIPRRMPGEARYAKPTALEQRAAEAARLFEELGLQPVPEKVAALHAVYEAKKRVMDDEGDRVDAAKRTIVATLFPHGLPVGVVSW